MNLARILLLSVLLVPVAQAQTAQPFQSLQRKSPGPVLGNVLVLIADDVGTDTLGLYGTGPSTATTPVLDTLAAEGVVFRNAWSSPMCSPTRAAIQTGRYGFRTGMGTIADDPLSAAGLPLAEITLPEMLDLGTDELYAHAAIGKWHLGHPSLGGPLHPNLSGYSHFSGTLHNVLLPYDHYSWPKTVDGVVSLTTAYTTTDQVDDAIAWITSVDGPWLCVVNFSAAHSPYQAPPAGLYHTDLTGLDADQDPRPFYEAMIEAIDTEIGRLLDALGPNGLDTTTVLFIGDNGTPPNVVVPPLTPDHAKFSLFEGGVHVPLIASGRAVAASGAECAALVHVVDVFATVADIAGVHLPTALPDVELDSRSLLPYLADPSIPSVRKVLYSEIFTPNGVGNPLPPPPCPPQPQPLVCQPDLGFAFGPATLTICGEELWGGNSAEVRIESAIPDGLTFLYVGAVFNPTPVLGGVLVPVPYNSVYTYVTDRQGIVTDTVFGIAPSVRYYQAAVFDAGTSGLYEFTNALEVESHWTNRQAIRSRRYKLISNVNTCEESLYDLVLDPLEQVDLLTGTLTPAAQQAYLKLKQALATGAF